MRTIEEVRDEARAMVEEYNEFFSQNNDLKSKIVDDAVCVFSKEWVSDPTEEAPNRWVNTETGEYRYQETKPGGGSGQDFSIPDGFNEVEDPVVNLDKFEDGLYVHTVYQGEEMVLEDVQYRGSVGLSNRKLTFQDESGEKVTISPENCDVYRPSDEDVDDTTGVEEPGDRGGDTEDDEEEVEFDIDSDNIVQDAIDAVEDGASPARVAEEVRETSISSSDNMIVEDVFAPAMNKNTVTEVESLDAQYHPSSYKGDMQSKAWKDFQENVDEETVETVQNLYEVWAGYERTEMFPGGEEVRNWGPRADEAAPMWQFAQKVTGNDSLPRGELQGVDVSDEEIEALESFKQHTEDILREVHGDSVEVYRGLTGEVADKLRSASEEDGSFEVDHHAVESWTPDASFATGFSSSGDTEGVVIKSEFPVEDIISASHTGEALFDFDSEYMVGHEGSKEYTSDDIVDPYNLESVIESMSEEVEKSFKSVVSFEASEFSPFWIRESERGGVDEDEEELANKFISSLVGKGRVYVDSPEEAPDDVQVQQGERGGLWYPNGEGEGGEGEGGGGDVSGDFEVERTEQVNAEVELSQLESDDVERYTSGDHMKINKELRSGDTSEKTERIREAINEGIRETGTFEETTVYRGLEAPDELVEQFEEGARISLSGFQSTSHDPDVATDFANTPDWAEGRQDVLMSIDTDRGLPTYASGNIDPNIDDEEEIILGHGWEYEISSVDKSGDEVMVKMSVVSD